MRLRDHTSVGEEWADYLKGIVPSGASAVQVEECKRAFYAGAYVMFGLVTADSLTSLDDDGAERRLQAIEKECVDYFKNFGRRHGV
jgi:hypothetical protein